MGHVRPEIHRAVVAEAGANLPGLRIQRDQPGIGGWHEQALPTGLALGRRRPCMVGKPAAGQVLAVDRMRHLGIEAPALLAGFGIQRDDQIVRRAQVQAVIDLERGDFVGGFIRVVRTAQIPGLVMPHRLQPLDVVRRDLCQRRVALALLAASVSVPVAGRHGLVHGRRFGQRRRQHALDVVTVVPNGVHRCCAPEHDRQHQRQRGAAPGAKTEVLPAQSLRDPGRQQPQPERCDDAAARRQLPPVQSHFVQRPTERPEHQQRVNPKRRAAAHQQQGPGQQKPCRDDGEIPGTAKADDLRSPCTEREPDDDAEHSADDHSHGLSPSILLFKSPHCDGRQGWPS